ncbi:MAG: acyltransferase [Ruminococcus sp.]|nr:acyltransferase [Ruminococcus sp.]
MNSTQKTAQKNLDFQVLYVLGMMFVLCGHFQAKELSLNSLFSYDTFHMPLFFFASGYFYKSKNAENIRCYARFARKKLIHLILPYLVWNIFYYQFAYILQNNTDFKILSQDEMNIRSFMITFFSYAAGAKYNVAGWFCVALFFVQILYNTLCLFLKPVRNDKIKNTFLLIITLCISICSALFADRLPIAISRTGYLMFFYNFGYFYHYNLEAIISRINCGYVLLSCCLVNTILIIMFGAIEPIVFNMYGFSSKTIPVHIIKAISGIMFWLTICRMIPKNVKAAKPIEYFSNHTFSIMMHQGIVGIFFNGIVIHLFKRYEFLEVYHKIIWMSAFRIKLLLPVLICISILLADKLYEIAFLWTRKNIQKNMIKCKSA